MSNESNPHAGHVETCPACGWIDVSRIHQSRGRCDLAITQAAESLQRAVPDVISRKVPLDPGCVLFYLTTLADDPDGSDRTRRLEICAHRDPTSGKPWFSCESHEDLRKDLGRLSLADAADLVTTLRALHLRRRGRA